jgi:hypothetical protein
MGDLENQVAVKSFNSVRKEEQGAFLELRVCAIKR